MNKTTIKALLIAGVLALTFGAGFYVKGQFVEAKENKQTKAVVRDAAKSVVTTIESSNKLEAEVAKTDGNVEQIQEAVRKRPLLVPKQLPPQENSHGRSTNGSTAATVADYELDLGTVRLLNAARQGLGVDALASSDAALAAAAAVQDETR